MIKICSALIKKNRSRVSLLTEGAVLFCKYRADALHRVEAKRKRDGTAYLPKTIYNMVFPRQIFSNG